MSQQAEKMCSRCRTTKPLTDFDHNPLGKYGKHSWCQPCLKDYKKERERRIRAGIWFPSRERLSTPHATVSPTTMDIGWVAGFLEGEGAFLYRRKRGSRQALTVCATQANPEPLRKLQVFLGGSLRIQRFKHGTYWYWTTSGARARGIAMTLYGLMSSRRKEQIRGALGRTAL